MSTFWKRLQNLSPEPSDRRWVFVPYDQLSDSLGPVGREDPRNLGIVLIENPWKAELRPYHKQKLALILSNMRHFALEQAARGVAVQYLVAEDHYRSALETPARDVGPVTVRAPAERELRIDIEPLASTGLIRIIPHEDFVTAQHPPPAAYPRCGRGRGSRYTSPEQRGIHPSGLGMARVRSSCAHDY